MLRLLDTKFEKTFAFALLFKCGSGMKVVYTLGGEAANKDDWELRISMRSWRKFYRKLSGFVVIGEKPNWLNADNEHVEHLPFPDSWQGNKDANLIAKLIYYSAKTSIHHTWIYCSDDQFLLQPIDTKQKENFAFQPWQAGIIKKASNTKFRRRLWNTRKYLELIGVEEPRHFDCHIPYRLQSAQVIETLKANFGEVPRGGFPNTPGYTIMSLIFGLMMIENPPSIRAERIRCYFNRRAPDTNNQIESRFGENIFLSLSENGLTDQVMKALEFRFPDKAPWEI